MTDATHHAEHLGSNGWQQFWNKGGWWKAVIVAAVYYGIYQLLALLVLAIFPESARGEKGQALDVFIGTGLPILLGGIVLVLFALSLGWLKQLFARQTVPGRRWMWVTVGIILAINVSAVASLDFGKAGLPLIASWYLTGLFVGFAEEVLTRGFAVTLLRKAGHGEITVALVSSAIFAALHFGNLFTSSQGLSTTLLQVVYTFFFGLCMYFALRVTGNLIWPILIHASTDPSLFLHGSYPAAGNPLSLVSAFSTYLVIITGIVFLIILIVSERRKAKTALTAPTIA